MLVAATDGRGNHLGYQRATATPAKIVVIDGYDVYVTFWTDPTETGTVALIHGSASTALGNRGVVYHFFGEDNPEVFVKVLDGCGINGHEWVYLAALTTLKYHVRLIRRSDGASRDYHGAMNVDPYTHSDAAAFACVDETDEPDLIVSSVSVSDATPVPGHPYELSATVLNRGGGPASQTTLRYYSSANSTIGMSDSFMASDPVAALSASATESKTIRLVSSVPGTIYLGACIDSVSDETNTRNNCSTGVRVIASAPSLSGTWSGATTSTLTPEVGSARATLVQTGSSLSGTWSVSYPSLGANWGTLTGAMTGSTVSVTLYPADPHNCRQSVTAILQGSSLSDTWSTINCTVTDSGSLRLTQTPWRRQPCRETPCLALRSHRTRRSGAASTCCAAAAGSR